MIPNQWYAILESREIPRRRLVGVTRMGENLIAWRDRQGRPTVMSERCPHRGASLRIGELTGDCVRCPFHGLEFDAGGACRLVPANGRDAVPPKALQVKTYPTREAHGLVYVWWGEPRAEYPPLPWLELPDEDMAYSTLRDHWKNHHARAIENQLDVMHLPFVHHNTIGAGNRTLVNGPVTRERSRWPGDHLIDVWVDNEVDRGQKPLRAGEMPEPGRHPMAQFCFPNLWQLWIGDEARIFIAFAPIDGENTMMYVRQYHRVRAPVLRQIFGLLGNLGNLVIERQDRRVIVTQRPHRPDLGIGEILIQGDQPIVIYRKRRRALIEGKEE